MDLAVVGVVLLGTALHPYRELVLKGAPHPEAAYLSMVLIWVVLATAHAWILGVDLSAGFAVLPLVLISAVSLMFYYIGILTTMKTGDLSIYYPIIRSSPLFIVIGGWLVLDQRYGASMLGGVGLVMVGAFFLQYKRGTRLLRQPATLATALLALAGLGTQSLADSEAIRKIEPAALLVWEYYFLAPACMVYFFFVRPRNRPAIEHMFGGWRRMPFRYLSAGAMSYMSYYLILVSYQMGGNVAAVNSLRQASIPLSVVLGGLLLKEDDTRSRLLWSVVLAAGIVVIIVAR